MSGVEYPLTGGCDCRAIRCQIETAPWIEQYGWAASLERRDALLARNAAAAK